jgi:diguanylate cyclase (GGDEF)-like protein
MVDLLGIVADKRRLLKLELAVLPLALLAVVAIDYLTPYQLNLSAFYMMVILLAGWIGGRTWGIGYSIVCSLVQIEVSRLIGSVYPEPFYFYFANANILFGYLCVAVIIAKFRVTYLREHSLARVDLLTGLANEDALYERVGYEIARQKRDGLPFAIAYIRCHHLRLVNESLGREVGNLILKCIGAAIKGAIAETDLAARPWGTQFCIVYSQSSKAEVERSIVTLGKSLDELIDGRNWSVSISIGTGLFLTSPADTDVAMAFCSRLAARAQSPENVNNVLRIYDSADEDAE